MLGFLVDLGFQSILILLLLLPNPFFLPRLSIRKILLHPRPLKQPLPIVQIYVQNSIRPRFLLMLLLMSMRHLHVPGLVMLIQGYLVKSVMSRPLEYSFRYLP